MAAAHGRCPVIQHWAVALPSADGALRRCLQRQAGIPAQASRNSPQRAALPLSSTPLQPERSKKRPGRLVCLAIDSSPCVALRQTLHPTVLHGLDIPDIPSRSIELTAKRLPSCHQDPLSSIRPVLRAQSSMSAHSHVGEPDTVHCGSGRRPRTFQTATVWRRTPNRSAISATPTGSSAI